MNYVGSTKGGIRHGQGEYTYSNDFFKYVGEWKEGKKDGEVFSL